MKWAAILGAAQLVVSGIGLWALLITIDQGRRALKAARKANEISHDSAKRELRAYMTFSEIVTHHVPDTNIWKMQLAWKNAGQTPARRVCTNADWAIFDANVPPDFPFAYDPAHDDGSLVEVGPGQPIYGLTPKDFPLATFPQIVAGKKCAIVWSSVDYTDVFGDEHRIEWSAFLVVNKNPDGTYGLIYRGFDRFCGSDELCMRKPYADNQETRYSR